jgi:hypothetical protein
MYIGVPTEVCTVGFCFIYYSATILANPKSESLSTPEYIDYYRFRK